MNVNKALFKFIKIAFGILVLMLIIYGTVRLCSTFFDFGYRVFNEDPVAEAPGEDVMISIEEGMDAKDLGQMLEDKGLVRDANLFRVQLLLSAYSKDMKPGVYTLNTSMTAKEMMVTISDVYKEKMKAESEAAEKETETETQTQSTVDTQPKDTTTTDNN